MPPPRRPRRRLRPPSCGSIVIALAVLAAAAWLTVRSLVDWVTAHPALPAGLIVAAAIGGYRISPPGPQDAALPPADAEPTDVLGLDPAGFEEYVADLCRRDGCTNVRVVGGAGDLGADVIARTPTGRRIVFQCKRYAPGRRVGSPDVQRVGGTYQVVHGADLAVVVTTSSFTTDAEGYARRAGIRLVDGAELGAWAAGEVLPPWGGERMMGA